MTEELRRPPAVTLACAGAAFAAFLVLTSTIGLLADWGSLELQEVVTEVIDEAGLAGSVSLDTALTWLQAWFYVVVVLAVAVLVLAAYTVRGDRPSRIALTFLCGFGGLVGSMFGAIIPGIVLIAATFMLWWPEARVWFDLKNGRTPSPELVARARARQRHGAQRGRDADVDALTGRGAVPPHNAAHPGSGAQPPRISGVTPPPPHHPAPPGYPPPAWGPPLPVVPRAKGLPGALIAAAVTSIVGSLLTAVTTGSVAMLYLAREVAPGAYDEAVTGDDPLLDLVPRLARGDDGVVWAIVVLSGLALVALASAGIAVALLFGRRRLLVAAIVLALLGAVGSAVVAPSAPAALVVTAACIATYVLLRHPSVRVWAAAGESRHVGPSQMLDQPPRS
ncbi:hypothetical protein [Aeromicrobium sp. Sec7.5]|uniref:hypothetical protein n=1 Tax=Aeromicrobium sp. Sec7.5 TaxID=3121276 RepID=UPI002FE4DD2A